MSSTVSVPQLALEIKPSRLLAIYVLCVYSIACLVIIILPLSPWLLSAGLCALLLAGKMTYQTRVNLRSRRAVVALNRYVDASWQLGMTDGATLQASLLPDSYLHPELLVLNFRLVNGKRRSVILVRDSADSTSLRRLRAALALGVGAALE